MKKKVYTVIVRLYLERALMKNETGVFNQREVPRIEASRLPLELRILRIRFADGTEYDAETIDASSKGIGFAAEVSANSILDFDVILEDRNNKFQIRDELIYVRPLDKTRSRMSLRFSKSNNMKNYLEILSNAE